LPSPGPEKNFYGGNTSCVQVEHKNTLIVLDGGSGIQRLGTHINRDITEVHIMLSHLHIDHTMGLGFFLPLYNPNITVHLWGPATSEESLLQRLRRYFSPPLFPVRLSELPKHPVIHELDHSSFDIGEINIKTNYICHPGPTLGFRLQYKDAVFAYMPDHEIPLGAPNFPNEPEWTSGFDIAKGADLLFHDSQYRPAEYASRVGWGHSSIEDTLAFAKLCKVKKLELFHHDPMHTDAQLNQLYAEFIANRKFDFEVALCAEGNVYELG
jgi:phosphoribosyl 1,2-cyclic phosphodiesterase